MHPKIGSWRTIQNSLVETVQECKPDRSTLKEDFISVAQSGQLDQEMSESQK